MFVAGGVLTAEPELPLEEHLSYCVSIVRKPKVRPKGMSLRRLSQGNSVIV